MALLVLTVSGNTAEFSLNGNHFTLPDGLELELIAGPPLVDRPICADFDERGRLYVADSSGSNENVKIQLETRPHRIVRLESINSDGRFDKSIIFADRMMFLEGTLWYNGSLCVDAPPEIWKLTDTNDDGVADRCEVWFDGKTCNGCANDLHGPYLGPDGWIYWCKGAFEEQTYERPGKKPFVTRAAHVFRQRPEGGIIELVMTGGMDNPVELIFTPGGERIFTTTFHSHPGPDVRDGLVHAAYHGVYGKVYSVLDGHPRKGPTMPNLVHMGAAAPGGLVRIRSTQLGSDFIDNLLACQFNKRKISRHVLTSHGGTFTTEDTDFLVSNNLDFHPTDVLEDADESLLVIDTGGWYKLCCPNSQLAKPDILGAIYRIRRTESHSIVDPRGEQIHWSSLSIDELTNLLADLRFVVRHRAGQKMEKSGTASIQPLRALIEKSRNTQQRRGAVWILTRIDNPAAREAVRQALTDPSETVRQCALHSSEPLSGS